MTVTRPVNVFNDLFFYCTNSVEWNTVDISDVSKTDSYILFHNCAICI